MSRKKKKASRKNSLEKTQEVLACFLGDLVSIYMFALIVVMPFYFTQGYKRIGTDKYEFLYNGSIIAGCIILPVWGIWLFLKIYGFWKEGERGKIVFWKNLSITDKFALGYAAVTILSYFNSVYREANTYGDALIGAKEWYMGLVSQLIFIITYFFISRFWGERKWMVKLWVPVAFVIFVLGYLNRFDIRPLEMKNDTVEYLSTIGNINWYCGYIVIILSGVLYYMWLEVPGQKMVRIGMMVWCVLGFATLLTQGSQSGILTLAVMGIVFYLLSMKRQDKLYIFGKGFLCLGIAGVGTCLLRFLLRERFSYQDTLTDLFTYSPVSVIIFTVALFFVFSVRYFRERDIFPMQGFVRIGYVGCAVLSCAVVFFLILGLLNTKLPNGLGMLSGNEWFTFDENWGSGRGATWAAGVMCFKDQDPIRRLIGVGPDCMVRYIYSGANSSLLSIVRKSFPYDALTNAHCEWLTMLVNVGILGTVCYVGMMVSAIVRFLKVSGKNAVIGACGFAILAYSVNNMVSFQQVMGATTIFFVLGIGEAIMRDEKRV